ncbi:MAG: methylsterol monooxygenase 1 [Bacteroidota bacterium]|jgi:4-alpha-methyl-delta7-sterol-4alpha-methyl oxidase
MTREEIALYTVLLLVCTNFIGLLYSLIVLKTTWFSAFQIQKKSYEKGVFAKRMPRYLLNFSILLLLSGTGAYVGYPLFQLSPMSGWIIALQVFVAFVFDDIFFYFMHRWLHENKSMLKKVHYIHHRAHKPFPLEYLYAHPFEWMLGMVGAFLGFGLILLVMPVHIYSFWIFGALRNLHEIHIHSDLKFPGLSHIPGISTSKNHDDHHAKLSGNYASTFSWMDRIFKTKF